MKISNSKKQLAKIIHENGGWRDGAESAAQCAGGEISFWHDTATKQPGEDWCGRYLGACDDIEFTGVKLPNWHQTILSRDEYFHLYPTPDADGWIEWSGGECPVCIDDVVDVMQLDGHTYTARAVNFHWLLKSGSVSVAAYRLHKPDVKPEPCESVTRSIPELSDKPTIEQLAADYRNRKDYADRKQQEADAAKADADVKLAELVAAGKALGLVLSAAGVAPEPDACADGWVEYDGGGCPVDANEVVEVFLRKGRPSLYGPKAAHEWNWSIEDVDGDIVKWRRAKGGTNA